MSNRSRAMLARHRLPEFRNWLRRKGWTIEAQSRLKEYEAVRAYKIINGKKKWAFVYDRNLGSHYTVFDTSLHLTIEFIKERPSRYKENKEVVYKIGTEHFVAMTDRPLDNMTPADRFDPETAEPIKENEHG